MPTEYGNDSRVKSCCTLILALMKTHVGDSSGPNDQLKVAYSFLPCPGGMTV